MRTVPAEIPRPEYAETGNVTRRPEERIKDAAFIERMRRAGHAAAEVLDIGAAAIAPGVTTDEIDAVVHQAYIDRGGYPSTLNYRGYPKSLCTSVNEVTPTPPIASAMSMTRRSVSSKSPANVLIAASPLLRPAVRSRTSAEQLKRMRWQMATKLCAHLLAMESVSNFTPIFRSLTITNPA
ncbi:MAG: Methionine aminopeptidase type [Actinomycetota bacterium]